MVVVVLIGSDPFEQGCDKTKTEGRGSRGVT